MVDCAGFGDTDKYIMLPNLTLIHKIIMAANKVVLVFIVKGESISASRG